MKEIEMADKYSSRSPQTERAASGAPELLDSDFQFVLKAFLAAYEPVLEQQVKLANDPAELEKEAQAGPPTSTNEWDQANEVFSRFLTDEVALRLIPSTARERLGPIEEWRWCLDHMRCGFVFGWLVCRGPRTFRAWTFYLYEYWRCVRETLGRPVATSPTQQDHRDFQTLVESLAVAFKPYLTDQLASVEYPAGIPEEVLSGKINSTEGEADACEIFGRFLTADAAQALLGKETFLRDRIEPNFWFCRCWSLSAICFGCCLARVRSLDGLIWCLVHYFRSLGACVQSLACDLTAPTGCIRGETDILPGRILEPVEGGAFGFNFGHYVIETRDGAGDLLSGVVIYPDSVGDPDTTLTQGDFAVAAGNLGWVDLRQCVIAAGVEIFTSTTFTVTLRVFASDGSELTPSCLTTFQLSLDEVYIKQISTNWSVNFTNPNEPLRTGNSAASVLATQGGSMNVRGAAFVAGCAGQTIAEYTIWAIPDPAFDFPQPALYSPVTPAADWVLVTQIDFTAQTIPQPVGPPITYPADKVRADNELNANPDSVLTASWGVSVQCPSILIDGIDFVPRCYNLPTLIENPLNSNTLPKMASVLVGGTGKFTFLLQVIDTAGNQIYDIQRAWIDNEPVQAAITGIAGLPPCGDLYTQNNTGAFQTVDVQGFAWDQLIDPVTPDYTKPTSDNFDFYTVTFQKQGAAEWITLINSSSPVPARPNPLGVGILTAWNLQWLDAATNPAGLPADQLLAQGQECTYVVNVQAYDTTVVNEDTTHSCVPPFPHTEFPIKVINGPQPL
jgi:hypothetical protein